MARQQLALRQAPPGVTPAAARGATEPPRSPGTQPLSTQLRRATRAIHEHTEATFELDRWLVDRDSYAALLTLLWGFHTAAEFALDRVDGWDRLTPGITLAARRRAFRIDQDLAELGATRPVAPSLSVIDPMGPPGLAEGLGCLYVIEGSALGGRVIAGRARAVLGPHLPTAFFADPDRNVGQDWNALRAGLDAFGTARTGTEAGTGTDAATGTAARRVIAVIAAAHRTFAAFAAVFGQERQRR